MFRLIRHAYRKMILKLMFDRYVLNNSLIEDNIENTITVRGCKVDPDTLKKKFYHLMLYYPDFAFIFFWRIKKIAIAGGNCLLVMSNVKSLEVRKLMVV